MKSLFSVVPGIVALLGGFAPAAAASSLPAEWTPPAILKHTNPPHPASMRLQGIEGTATVIFIVNESGLAEDVTIYSASHRSFGASLQDTLRQWRFEPARFLGEPVPARVRLKANFRLEGAVISMSSADHVAAHITRFTDSDDRPGYHVALPRELDAVPRPVHTVMPGIPPETPPFDSRVKIHVDFILAPDGTVRAPAVTDSTDSEAAPYLAASAINAVRQWTYSAPTVRGKEVYAHLRQVIVFDPPGNGVP